MSAILASPLKRRLLGFSVVWLGFLALAIYGKHHPELWHPANSVGVFLSGITCGAAAMIWAFARP